MANADIEAARVFHELTSHSYTSVRSSPHLLDWDNKPLPYKIYPDAPAIALPRDLQLARMSVLEALAPAPDRLEASLDLPALTRILFCAGGLTRRKRVGSEDYHFRAAPSAGALYPIEIYLAAGEIDGLAAGLFHFSPADLKLRALRPHDWRARLAQAAGANETLRHARAIIILTSIFWRSAWKYRARAYRYCLWDAGTMLANLLAASRAEGVENALVTAFADGEVEALLGIDGAHEGALCLIALGKSRTAPVDSPGEIEPLRFESIPLSDHEVVYDDLVKIHRESRLKTEEVAAVARPKVLIMPGLPEGELAAAQMLAIDAGDAFGATILRRGSTREFAQAAITAAELATIMASSSAHPRADFPRLTETYLTVTAVDGMTPGVYYYRRETGQFELLKAGGFRAEAGYLCLEQPLGMDCSALVVYMADLERVLAALGNRGYRDAHLEAGILGGRAYLAAYALGRGATGLTFYDQDTTNFLGPHAQGKSPIFMVALGVPKASAAR